MLFERVFRMVLTLLVSASVPEFEQIQLITGLRALKAALQFTMQTCHFETLILLVITPRELGPTLVGGFPESILVRSER